MKHLIMIGAGALVLTGAAVAQTMTPQADTRAPGNAAVKSSDVKQSTMAAKGANSFTEKQARTRIAHAGFTNVSALKKDADGLWQGTAMKGGKSVAVALDFKGNVVGK